MLSWKPAVKFQSSTTVFEDTGKEHSWRWGKTTGKTTWDKQDCLEAQRIISSAHVRLHDEKWEIGLYTLIETHTKG